MAKSTIKGDRELVAALKALSVGVPVAEIDQAALSSLRPMQDEMVARYKMHRQDAGNPHYADWGKITKSGEHVDQLITVKKDGGAALRRQYRLGGLRRARFILHLLEFGTAPHYQPKRKIFHPGARAFPVMVPAYESFKGDVVSRFGKDLWRRLEARAIRLGRGSPK